MTNSVFDDLEGVGEKRKEKLRIAYPTIDALLNASVAELSQIIPLEAAKALYARLHD